MSTAREELAAIHTFPQLVHYLHRALDWPVTSDDFEDLVFDYTAEDLGIDAHNAAKILEIKRLRPLSVHQPWGIFFVKFEPKRLPVVALRRILSGVALKKRASANSPDHPAWAVPDLLFISNYGEGDARQISFAHFSQDPIKQDLPTLKVLGWDNLDTPLHLDDVAESLARNLVWPDKEDDIAAWRSRWEAAFTLGHREVISTSREMAIRLAELARVIRDRIRGALAIETDRGPLTQLMKAVQVSLVHDLDARGFADMYAQTIAYGLLSARIADPESSTAGDLAGHMRTNPLLRDLLETFLHVGGRRGTAGGPGIDFDELGVAEVVEVLSSRNIEAVLRDFGDRNPEHDPVIHFYELFLKEYDEQQRMRRGVFYTPRPVVSFIVRSVDDLLRTEFGLTDGLADTTTWAEMAARDRSLSLPQGVAPTQAFVQILDPAAGTGTFLVEVIDVIHNTMTAKWRAAGATDQSLDSLWNEYVPKYLLPRLYGFELLMAPYAIAHLKVGLKLLETGYRFASDERARVFLTNSLEPARDAAGQLQLLVPALALEARAVNEVKRDQRFTVVVGNPPYSSISQNMGEYIWGLVNEYLTLPDGPMREKSNRNHLQDDYVKFVRLSQALVQASGRGVVGLITNNSYLAGAWYRGMRYHLLSAFSGIDIVNLHGGKGFVRSASAEDENVFDIMQSVGIGIFTATPRPTSVVTYRQLVGPRAEKYRRLGDRELSAGVPLDPSAQNQWLLEPVGSDVLAEWNAGISLEEVFENWGAGVKTNRNGLAIAFTPGELRVQIEDFADLALPDDLVEARYSFGSNYQWQTGHVRRGFSREGFSSRLVTPYLFRPFDQRWIYWHPSVVFNMRGDKMEVFRGEAPPVALLFSRTTIKDQYSNFFVSRLVADHDCLEKTKVAALYTSVEPRDGHVGLGLVADRRPNLSRTFLAKVAARLGLDLSGPDGLPYRIQPEDLFNYAYAVFHSPTYRDRYADMLRLDFPRLPLVGSLDLLRVLSALGNDLVELHLGEAPHPGQREASYTGPADPKVEFVTYANGVVRLDKAGTASFSGVPPAVWDFSIGGSSVCEKWLKERRGRSLSPDEISHYQDIAFALSETIRLMGEIDEIIDQHGGWPGAFATT